MRPAVEPEMAIQAFSQKTSPMTCARCAPRSHANADLTGAARGGVSERSIETDGGHQQRADGEEDRQHGHHAFGAKESSS